MRCVCRVEVDSVAVRALGGKREARAARALDSQECAPMSTCTLRGWQASTTKACVQVCVDSSSLMERGRSLTVPLMNCGASKAAAASAWPGCVLLVSVAGSFS